MDKVTIISKKTYYISIVMSGDEFERAKESNDIEEILFLVDQEELNAIKGVFESESPEFLAVEGDVSDWADGVISSESVTFESDFKNLTPIKPA